LGIFNQINNEESEFKKGIAEIVQENILLFHYIHKSSSHFSIDYIFSGATSTLKDKLDSTFGG